MSRFKRIEYIKVHGIEKDEHGKFVDREIPMVALYDSEHVTEEQANKMLRADEESPYLMLVHQVHYDNILQPAVSEAKKHRAANDAIVPPVRVGDRIKAAGGKEYIIIDYEYRKHYCDDTHIRVEENVTVMNNIYADSTTRRTHQYTLEEFATEFPDYVLWYNEENQNE
jgi:uncharacterized protein with LGFP repeats